MNKNTSLNFFYDVTLAFKLNMFQAIFDAKITVIFLRNFPKARPWAIKIVFFCIRLILECIQFMSFETKLENGMEKVGGRDILHALFSTISFNLEPDGWGTRFPVLFKQVYWGKLYASDANAALSELEVIKSHLSNLPICNVIWNYENRTGQIPHAYKYNQSAKSLAEFFYTEAGRDFLSEIADSLEAIVEFPQNANKLSYKFPLDFIND